MPLVADLHIHSHFSRATSKDLTLPQLAYWAQLKGVHLVGTGDIAHPGWLAEIKEHLEPAEEGLFRLKPEYEREVQQRVPPSCRGVVRFVLGGEISTIYKKGGRVRKIHHVVFLPTLEAVEAFQARLSRIGNIESDGRPILGLDSRDLLEILLEVDQRSVLIPAHIWTPWFALLGSKSGFDSVEECFEDLTPHIFALETGLSSDPPMNWRVSALDRYTLVSNSDAHSPAKLGREANLLDISLSYSALFAAIREGDPQRFLGTIEFFPEEGKYHYDGHRKCGVCWHPVETRQHQGRCPVCGNPVTVGVLHRVEELADRPEGVPKPNALPFYRLVPLPEVLGELYGVGANSKRVRRAYQDLLRRLGPEIHILLFAPLEEIATVAGPTLAEGIQRMREGRVQVQPGFDGQYGVIRVFPPGAARSPGQGTLFAVPPAASPAPPPRPAPSSSGEKPRPDLAPGLQERAEAYAPQAPPSASVPQGDVGPAAPGGPGAALARLLHSLDPDQRAAVEAPLETPLLIVAGPGTGKTRTLTARLAHAVLAGNAPPSSVLAVTFTNRAAEEMRRRLRAWLGPEVAEAVAVHTFHSLGLALLREWSRTNGPDAAEPRVLPEAEARRLFHRLFPKVPARTRGAWWERIWWAKAQALDPQAAAARHPHQEWVVAYRAYQQALDEAGALDYGDLLLRPLLLLEAHPQWREQVRARFQVIGVDEYQDLNEVQYRLLRLLARDEGRGLTAIGDPRQAIYGFRGASPRYFLRFREDFPQAQVVHLTRNYRSAPGIVRAAQALLPAEPPLEPTRSGPDAIDVWETPTDRAEAETLAHTIEALVGGTSYFSLDSGRVRETEVGRRVFGEIAILVRMRALLPPIEEALRRAGIPYLVYTDRPWAERPGVGALLAFLQSRWSPHLPSLWETLLTAFRLDAEQARVWSQTLARLEDPWAALAQGEVEGPEPLPALARLWQRLPPPPARVDPAWIGALREPWEATVSAFPKHEDLLPAAEDWDALRYAARESRGRAWAEWLTALHLAREHDFLDPRAERVHILTLHAAKGLEFPVVFLPACEDGILPYRRPGEETDEAEERRLFYVGLTRGQDRVIVTWSRKRRLFGKEGAGRPSPFLEALPPQLRRERRPTPPAKRRPRARQLSLFE